MIEPAVFIALVVACSLFILGGIAAAICYLCRVLKKDAQSRYRGDEDQVIVLDGTEPPPPYA